MKKYIYIAIAVFFYNQGNAQNFCSQPNPNFCPGNYFNNGDFENYKRVAKKYNAESACFFSSK